MAAIDSFRKLIVYSSLLRSVRSNWDRTIVALGTRVHPVMGGREGYGIVEYPALQRELAGDVFRAAHRTSFASGRVQAVNSRCLERRSLGCTIVSILTPNGQKVCNLHGAKRPLIKGVLLAPATRMLLATRRNPARQVVRRQLISTPIILFTQARIKHVETDDLPHGRFGRPHGRAHLFGE